MSDDIEQAGPEVHLWRAVLAQAIADATAVVRPRLPKDGRPVKERRKEAKSYMSEAMRERDRARDWLLGNSKDFRDVCAMAMLDAAAVRESAERLAARGWYVPRPRHYVQKAAA